MEHRNPTDVLHSLTLPRKQSEFLLKSTVGAVYEGPSAIEIVKKLTTESGETAFLNVIDTGTQLSVISKEYGTSTTTTALILMISEFASLYNVFTPMSPAQVADLAEDLAVNWWHYTIEDFACFFSQAKKNKYGLVTSRMDRGVILEMLDKYENQRREAIFEREAAHRLKRNSEVVPEGRMNGEFSIGDMIPVIKGEKTIEEVLEEKKANLPPPVVAPDTSAETILEYQIEMFVEKYVSGQIITDLTDRGFYNRNKERIEQAWRNK